MVGWGTGPCSHRKQTQLNRGEKHDMKTMLRNLALVIAVALYGLTTQTHAAAAPALADLKTGGANVR